MGSKSTGKELLSKKLVEGLIYANVQNVTHSSAFCTIIGTAVDSV